MSIPRVVFGLPLIVGVCMACLACGDSVQQSERGMGNNAPAAAAKPATAAVKLETLAFKDDDFVESERHRDPFRSFALGSRNKGGEQGVPDNQRMVIMPETPVEEMKLIAVISGLTRPKAMLTDSKNVGYVVQRGDYVGRPKVFQSTGSVAMTLNWRVERIRDNEVVLTRQDPAEQGRPPLSRIISMHDEMAAR
jgi:Tfp pilus assembly protein PilP